MTNRLAIILGLVLIGASTADVMLNDTQALLFLARKMFVLLDFLAFWR